MDDTSTPTVVPTGTGQPTTAGTGQPTSSSFWPVYVATGVMVIAAG